MDKYIFFNVVSNQKLILENKLLISELIVLTYVEVLSAKYRKVYDNALCTIEDTNKNIDW